MKQWIYSFPSQKSNLVDEGLLVLARYMNVCLVSKLWRRLHMTLRERCWRKGISALPLPESSSTGYFKTRVRKAIF